MAGLHYESIIYKLEVGFWGNRRRTKLLKVRTMITGADKQIPLLRSTRLNGGRSSNVPDTRILGAIAEKGRRTSQDEGIQPLQVVMGQLDLVGLRGWVVDTELRDLIFLYKHRNDPELIDLRPLLNIYRERIRQFDPKPAIVSQLSASFSKDSLPYTCILGDLLWIYTCNWNVWTHLVVNTYRKRILKSVGSR